MFFYWRVQQDLTCLGETLIFHEPCLIRSLERWIRKNATGITIAEGYPLADPLRPNMN